MPNLTALIPSISPGSPPGLAATVTAGSDADGMVTVRYDVPPGLDVDGEDGYEQARWVSPGGYEPAPDDVALLILDSQGAPWAIVTPAAGVTTPVAVLRESPLNMEDDRVRGDFTAALALLPDVGGRPSGEITVPAGRTYEVTEGVDASDTGGVTIRGMGGAPGWPRLIWKGGAGSGPMFTAHSAFGLKLVDLLLGYDHPAYDGDLIQFGHSAAVLDPTFKLEGCWLGGLDGATGARFLVNPSLAINSRIVGCDMQNAQRAIAGRDGADYVTTLTIQNTQFANMALSPLWNPDNTWRIRDCTFEPLADGSAGAVDHDMSFWTSGFLYEGNYHADASAGGTWVRGRFSGGLIGGGNYVVVPPGGTGYFLQRTFGLTFNAIDVQPGVDPTGTTGIEFSNVGGSADSEGVTVHGGQNTCVTPVKHLGNCANFEVRGVYPIATNPPRGVNEGYVGVASASAITVPTFDQGGLWLITGTTTILSIGGSWPGRMITLLFASTAQVTDGGNLDLEGDFIGGAGRTLTLRWDANVWNEIGRSTN